MPLYVDNDCDLTVANYQLALDSSFINDAQLTVTIAEASVTGRVEGAAGTPVIVTSAAHGLTTGQQVILTQCRGNTAANGVWTVTALTANTFRLDGSLSNAAFLPDAQAKWNRVVPGAANVTVARVLTQNGRYRATLPLADLPIVAGKSYLLVIKAANYDDQIERIETAAVRTS